MVQSKNLTDAARKHGVKHLVFATGKVTVRTDLTGVLELVVANALWQVVFYEKMEVQEVAVDLSGLLQGLYFISMKTEDGRIFSRKCLRE